jgi:hypothetical protein
MGTIIAHVDQCLNVREYCYCHVVMFYLQWTMLRFLFARIYDVILGGSNLLLQGWLMTSQP